MRAIHKRSRKGDALLLSAAEFARASSGKTLHLHHAKGFFDAAADFTSGRIFHAKPERDVVAGAQVRKQGVVLKNRVDAALIRRQDVQALADHPNFSRRRLFESGNQAKKRGLAGTAFAKKREKFTGSDIQRNIL